MENIKKWDFGTGCKMAGYILIPVVIIFLSLLISGNHVGEYFDYLKKPDIAPKSEFFIPIIISVYTLFGYGLSLVCSKKRENKEDRGTIALYAVVTLFLHFLFILTLFKYQLLNYALYLSIALGILSSAMIRYFKKTEKRSLKFLIPYLIFVLYIVYITYFIYSNN